MSAGQVLRTLTLIWPLVELVDRYLDGDNSPDVNDALKALPDTLRSRLALERAKRRTG